VDVLDWSQVRRTFVSQKLRTRKAQAGRRTMNTPRFRLTLAAVLAVAVSIASPLPAFAGAGRGGHSAAPGGGKQAPATGSSPSRRVGPHGGLGSSHFHRSSRVFVSWPWWSLGVGWGWPYFGFWGYDAFYPAYSYRYPQMAPPDASAAIELHVSPRKATVKLDGYEVGQARDFNDAYTPLFLTGGDHILEFTYRGYKTLRVRVHGSEGQSIDLHFDLEKGEGIDARSEAADRAPVPAAMPASEAAPMEKPAPGARGALRTGMMRIRVEPSDAAVYLDGEFLGTADELSKLHGALSVAVGEHRVEAVRPGYRTQTAAVTVTETGTEILRLSLEAEPKN